MSSPLPGLQLQSQVLAVVQFPVGKEIQVCPVTVLLLNSRIIAMMYVFSVKRWCIGYFVTDM